MRAKVHVFLKPGVLDPQGRAIQHALSGLGFADVEDVRAGKLIELELGHEDRARAEAEVEAMAARLLANPVIESWRIEFS